MFSSVAGKLVMTRLERWMEVTPDKPVFRAPPTSSKYDYIKFKFNVRASDQVWFASHSDSILCKYMENVA